MFNLFPIIDGEAVSHWLARTAAATEISPAQLVDNLGIPLTQQPFPATIARLEKVLLANSELKLGAHTPLAEYPTYIQQTLAAFIPNLGPRGHINGGVSYCPHCLSEGQPFMARWQNSLLTVCTKHWTPMLSHCPGCEGSVNYILSFKRQGCSRVCHQCEARLDTALPAMDVHESTLQRILFDCLHGTLAPPAGSNPKTYVSGIKTIIEYLRSHYSQLVLEEIATKMKIPNSYGGYTRQKEFNKQSLAWRRMVVNLSIWLSMEWPDRLEQILSKVSPNVLHADRPNLNW